jgi:hypothetical protein
VTYVFGSQAAAAVHPWVRGVPSATALAAPAAAAKVNTLVAARARSLPRRTTLAVQLLIAGKWTLLTSVRTSSKGVVTLPAIQATRAGSYLVQLRTIKGVVYYVKIVVPRRG